MTEHSRPTTAVSLPRLTEAPSVKSDRPPPVHDDGPEPVKVLIEYCQRCYRHPWCVNHSEERYFSQFMDIAGRVSRAFPGVVDEIVAVKDPRIGALEVTVVHGDHQQVVFSKLESDRWPNVPKVLERIRRVSQRMVDPGPKSSLLIENEFLTPRHRIIEVALAAEAPVPFALGLEITDRPPFLVTVVQEGKYGAECGVVRGDVLHCINGQACDRMDLEGLLTELRKRPMNLYCRRFDRTKKRPRPVGSALSFARLFGRRPISMRAEKAATAHMQRQRKGMTTIDTIPPRPPPSKKLPKPTYKVKRVERHDEKGPTIGPAVQPPKSAPQQGHRPRPKSSQTPQPQQKPSEQSRSEMLLQNPGRIRPAGRSEGNKKAATKPSTAESESIAEPTKKEEVGKVEKDVVEATTRGEELKEEGPSNVEAPSESKGDGTHQEIADAPPPPEAVQDTPAEGDEPEAAPQDDDEYEDEFESEDEKWDEGPPDAGEVEEPVEGDSSHNPDGSTEARVAEDKPNEMAMVEEEAASPEVADVAPPSPQLSDVAPAEIVSVDGDAEEEPASQLATPVKGEENSPQDEADEAVTSAFESEKMATSCPGDEPTSALPDATPSPQNVITGEDGNEGKVGRIGGAVTDEMHEAMVSNVVDDVVRRASSRLSAAPGTEGSTEAALQEEDAAKAAETPKMTVPVESGEAAAPVPEDPVEAAAPVPEDPVEAAAPVPEDPVEAAAPVPEDPVEAAAPVPEDP
ncbi:hypothetical protein FOL47_007782, partial [Perkinsus chesapeaki]